MMLSCSGASPKEITRARRVVETYHKAWITDDLERMFELSSTKRIIKLTGIDPRKGKEARKLAFSRLALVVRHTIRMLHYSGFEVVETVNSTPAQIVFKLTARHMVDGKERTSMLVRKLVREAGQWKLD